MVNLNPFIISFIFFFKSIIHSYITLNYHHNSQSHYIILNVDHSITIYLCQIELSSLYTWYLENPTDTHSDLTNNLKGQSVLISTPSGLFRGDFINQTLCFEDKSIPPIKHFSLLNIINNSTTVMNEYPKCVLGLGFTDKEEQYSLLHHMKSQGLITQASFGISIEDNKLYIGGLPDIVKNKKYHSYFNVANTDSTKWTCKLQSIRYNNNTIEYSYDNPEGEDNVIFSTTNNVTKVPAAAFDYLVDTVFKEMVKAHVCFVSRGIYDEKMIHCVPDEYYQKGNISFVIGEYKYTMQFRQLWLCLHFYCYFSLKENNNGNDWVFGSDFYKTYNIEFNNEDQRIHVYSDYGIESLSSNDSDKAIHSSETSNSLSKTLTIITMLMLTIGIVLGVSVNIKTKALIK